jgi:hypothetical protein
MVMGVNVPREALIPADCMAAPAVWLASNASDGVTGNRFLGIKWDVTLPPDQAALAAAAPVTWTGYGDQIGPRSVDRIWRSDAATNGWNAAADRAVTVPAG